jgi:chemotaxis protein histidine kinase CheA
MSISMVVSKLNLKKVVELLSKKYNFEEEEALRMLVEKKEKSEKSKKSKDLSPPVEKVSKCIYPMPFNGEKKEGYCNGVVKNHGLYTQCAKKVKESSYCKGCEDAPYGTIDDRLKVDLYEYKDPKGNGPKRYTEVLKKLKISKENVEEEAKRLNITINPIHFEEVVSENVKRGRPKTEKKVKETTGKKGRPKKEKKSVEVNNGEEEDLFATLIANAHPPLEKVEPNDQPLVQPLEKVEPNEDESKVLAPPVVEKVEKKSKKVKETDPAKEAEKQKKAEEKAAKEAEKQKKAEDKAAKEAEKEIEKQKKAEEKAAKEAEKQKKADEKAAKNLAPPFSKVDTKVEEEAADVVRKFEHEGKSYYKSKNSGVIYNMEQEVVGKWNEERNAIDFEEEEEEEEYDD